MKSDIGAIHKQAIAEQASAWQAVCELLDQLYPEWTTLAGKGTDCACEAIRRLASALPAPDGLDFIDTAPEFTRDGMYRALVGEKMPAPGEAVDEAMVQAALSAKVANGEDVFWNLVFGMQSAAEFERKEIAAEIVRTILKSAYATAPPLVGERFVLAPVDATQAMIEAGVKRRYDRLMALKEGKVIDPGGISEAVANDYKAMLAAHAARGG